MVRNSRRVVMGLKVSGDQTGQSGRGIKHLLVCRIAVTRFHLCDQPAVVYHFAHCLANSRPVVVAQEDVGVNTLITTPATMLQDVLLMDARDPRPMNLNPLLGKAGVMN